MLKNKKFLLATLVATFVLVACGNNNSEGNDTATNDQQQRPVSEVPTVGERTDQDILTVITGGDVQNMDIHGANDVDSSRSHIHVFSTLVVQDHNLEIQPGLAEDWRQIDDLTWEFDIQEGVLFHNGDVMTAYDVAFSLGRAATAPIVAPILGMIDEDAIEVVDDTTIRIGTTEPFGPFLNHLAHPASSILNESVIGDYEPGQANQNNIEVIGTGPYRFIEMVSGSHITFERFDDYHGEAPNIRELTFRFIEDQQARTAATETGEADITLNPAFSDLERLFASEDMYIIQVPGLGSDYLGLSVTFPGLDDVRVRQAIDYALDTQEIVDAAFEGWVIAGQTVIAESVFGHHPDLLARERDVERARELMEEAGFNENNPFRFTIWTNGENVSRRTMAEIIQNQLEQIHIEATMDTMEFGAFMEARDDGELDAFIAGWVAITADADYALFPSFHSSSHGAGGNHILFEHERVDELLQQARSTSDPEARLVYYHEAQEIIHEEVPWIALNQNDVFVVVQNNVRGVDINPTQSHFFGNVYFVD